MTTPSDSSPPPAPERTIRRILTEAAFVAVAGALVLGVLWEAGFPDVGWIVAAIVWAGGTSLLEIVRLLQVRLTREERKRDEAWAKEHIGRL